MGAWIETLKVDPRILNPIVVAPYVGAWIETAVQEQMKHNQQVAPYVGAWIETEYLAYGKSQTRVAPYVGAWIETCSWYFFY